MKARGLKNEEIKSYRLQDRGLYSLDKSVSCCLNDILDFPHSGNRDFKCLRGNSPHKIHFYKMDPSLLRKSFIVNRDLTIRQWPRRPRKVVKKQTSHPSKLAQLFKRRQFKLELKRRECARLKTEIVEFIALPGSRSQVNVKFGRVTSIVE